MNKSKLKKYRPKHYISYIFGTVNTAYISCYPQSRWDLISKSTNRAILTNKNTTIYLKAEDFEKHWVEVKEKGENK